MKKPQSNQATPNILGFIYQVLVSIEKCFDAEINQTIYIECFGDVADKNCSTEVKHHFDDGNLTDNSIDFWKTLKNIVKEDTSNFEMLILHTTHTIPDDGIFFEWNKKTPTAKYNALKNHTPTDTVKIFYDFVFETKRKNLLPVLAKFELFGSQLKIADFSEGLLDHKILCLAPKEERRDILWWLHGYMFNKAIKNRYLWHVDINEFREDISSYVSQFQNNGIQFPYVKKTDVNAENEFIFLQELESIGVRKGERTEAVSDYLRMKLSEVKLLTKKPLIMEGSLCRYEEAVSKKILGYKSKLGRKLTINDLNSDVCKYASLEVFDNFKVSEKLDLVHVDNTEYYFMTGKAHHLVESNKLTWHYKEEDLE